MLYLNKTCLNHSRPKALIDYCKAIEVIRSQNLLKEKHQRVSMQLKLTQKDENKLFLNNSAFGFLESTRCQ